jgi:hypothetical protein
LKNVKERWTMDSSERDDATDESTKASEPTPERSAPVEPPADLADEEGFPKADPLDMPVNREPETAAPAVEPPRLAEPGVYVCIHENAGEHQVLGRLDYGTEYDYSQVTDEPTLIAIAACVQGGLLEKQD